MTENDLSLIESALRIRLPSDYRQLLLNYPIRADRETDDSILWDDATSLIEANLEYRAGFAGLKPWPEHFYMIGDDGAASPFVIDLRSSPSPVFQLDHGNPNATSQQAETITNWISTYIEEMKANGQDPAAERPRIGPWKAVLMLLLTVVVASAIGWVIWRLTG